MSPRVLSYEAVLFSNEKFAQYYELGRNVFWDIILRKAKIRKKINQTSGKLITGRMANGQIESQQTLNCLTFKRKQTNCSHLSGS